MSKKKEQLPDVNELNDLLDKFKTYKKNIDTKKKDYLQKVDKDTEDYKKKQKIEILEQKVTLKKELLGLKETKQMAIQDFKSDDRFTKAIAKIEWYSFIRRHKFKRRRYCLIIMHKLDNNDVAKFFEIENHIVDINGKKYLFNPVHFRYINAFPTLYFYQGNPFCKLVDVADNYSEPTISTEAFTSVLKSKYVMDAVKGEEGGLNNVIIIIVIILAIINLIISVFLIMSVQKITDTLGV